MTCLSRSIILFLFCNTLPSHGWPWTKHPLPETVNNDDSPTSEYANNGFGGVHDSSVRDSSTHITNIICQPTLKEGSDPEADPCKGMAEVETEDKTFINHTNQEEYFLGGLVIILVLFSLVAICTCCVKGYCCRSVFSKAEALRRNALAKRERSELDGAAEESAVQLLHIQHTDNFAKEYVRWCKKHRSFLDLVRASASKATHFQELANQLKPVVDSRVDAGGILSAYELGFLHCPFYADLTHQDVLLYYRSRAPAPVDLAYLNTLVTTAAYAAPGYETT